MSTPVIDIGKANQPQSKPIKWEEPQPLVVACEAEDYPLEALPPKVQAAVKEVQDFVQAPVAMVASCALSALSVAIQSHVDVKRGTHLQSPSSLFLLVIADSGERKSTCDGFFTRAIRDYEEAQRDLAKPEIERHDAEMAAWESKRAGIKDQIRQLAKTGKPTDGQKGALVQMQKDMPEQPKIPRLLYGDATPEALAYSLSRKWPTGGVLSAEAGSVFGSHGMGKDSITRNLSMLNILWDGKPLPIDRRTSESFIVDGARLTVALQVQEAVLREFFERAGTLARGSGFLARFLLAVPESTIGSRPFKDIQGKGAALADFNLRMKEILDKSPLPDSDGRLKPEVMELSPQAKSLWTDFYNATEQQLKPDGKLAEIKDVVSKIADNAARLAALFEVFENGKGEISRDSMARAIVIATWHLSESHRFFAEFSLPDELADAVRLEDWLIKYCKRKNVRCVEKSRAFQYSPIRKKIRLDAAIDELVERDRLRVQNEIKPVMLSINPSLLSANTC